ncbi:glutamine--fructose-6-phosphate transaminase (isomerizing) [Liquorilactobacillus satsumensis]|uniref:glutamine--fructose-6-phosphate transaminase (isomerizing) n=1 Tax=Liquorilactobacillus satsumensis TaxID=259059 RepID=UPI001E60AD05|nr:glutamine--fructose-6-phosphate transaminase (isomerizing) [Liquorilactobacillus satsumensis]MCC7667714.1 glutamine--fructose-6-phosphate transaminase (isomerizing) [Liquorilactobacillus satsumensis]MCP9313031.1 glutamine--fructose-6-phosphate transaminase (isomerizing) [Liquorilactobacillus satsumensis]MCP9328977.1 glutamine--fructose-6-phosphate transaminase (isomerizing) [Liquorilactobacillus satsumensis]MCP9357686.1 glutamine--fructose-6-phosphate transaminase (isomerizing) [Liquorilacto
MCGIVGVTGKQNAVEILLKGLERLEYRGYDSAGIYVNDQDGKEYLVKEKGRISELRKEVSGDVHGSTGIGHTRWATHGAPSKANAHPHVSADGRYYLVHNGVIGNFAQLKEEYLQDVTFKSDTDTEVVVQLIAKFAQQGLETKAAFKKVLSLIDESSSYSFLLVDHNEPDTLYVAKNKSPLLIGVGQGFNVVCSDALAMLDQTHDFIELVDGEIVVVKPNSVTIEDPQGKVMERKPFHVSTDASEADKGAYPYYMLKEIDEQPGVMRSLIKHYVAEDGSIKIAPELLTKLNNADRLYIVAAGTSYHAGLVGREIFEGLTKIPTEVHVASEFAYNPPLLSQKPFFIFLTQSGETADSRQVLSLVNQWGYQSLTITNVENSTLSREATHTLLLYAGPEIAVASTKAYTGQIALEALLAKAMGAQKGLTTAANFEVAQELTKVANGMQELVDEKAQIEKIATAALATTRNAFYIGRAIDYDIAQEAALKLKEVSYVQTEGFASGELKHGTIALIEKDTPVVAIITDAKTAKHTRSNAQEVLARGANVIYIVSRALAEEGDQIVLPDVHPLLTPLLAIVPCQLLAYYTSLQRGYDVDKPRNLAKSVTVE